MARRGVLSTTPWLSGIATPNGLTPEANFRAQAAPRRSSETRHDSSMGCGEEGPRNEAHRGRGQDDKTGCGPKAVAVNVCGGELLKRERSVVKKAPRGTSPTAHRPPTAPPR
eukprot:scaffold19923_cov107-Isochrysis_galbana.AAC.7